jgi:hypothetical protein
MLPKTTRLRFVYCPAMSGLSAFCDNLGKRIEIKTIAWDGTNWVMWFVPDDKGNDVSSGKLNKEGMYVRDTNSRAIIRPRTTT